MLAHAGGAAALDAPTWLLAYGAAALVLVTTVALRGRIVVAAARFGVGGDGAETAGDVPEAVEPLGPSTAGAAWRWVGRTVGVAALTVVTVAAFAGPARAGANLAPTAVLSVWWVGLPLACVVAGDVMGWLDPFGTLARPGRRALERRRHPPRDPGGWPTAALFFAGFAWWVLAFHDGRSPRALGWFLVAYTGAAVAGAVVWGHGWLRRGEGFGAVSSGLADVRRATRRSGQASRTDADHLLAPTSVWLGAVAFDLFSGTRAWVDLAGTRSGWARTAVATWCLLAAIALAGVVVVGTVRLAAGALAGGSADRAGALAGGSADRSGAVAGGTADRTGAVRAGALAWLAVTAGAFLAHGIPSLLVDGQVAWALASDPFGQGRDLFGTATRAVDYSPLTPGLVGTLQLVAAAGGAVGGIVAAAAALRPGGGRAAEPRSAVAVLWVLGVSLAVTAALAVAVVAGDLE